MRTGQRRSTSNDARQQRLTMDYLRDLAVDIRCARRDGLPDYADKCAAEFRRIWRWRHVTMVGRYGVPITATV